MMGLLKQKRYAALDVADQVIAIFAAKEGYIDDLDLTQVVPFRDALAEFMAKKHPHTRDAVREGRMSDETQDRLRKCVEEFKEHYAKRGGVAAQDEEPEQTVPGFTD
jgi:F-type H+-transporting ATPase subunit alpha